jgi:phosphate transport system permease protein
MVNALAQLLFKTFAGPRRQTPTDRQNRMNREATITAPALAVFFLQRVTVSNHHWRKAINVFMQAHVCVRDAWSFAPLRLVFFHLLRMGASSLNLDFFTHLPKRVPANRRRHGQCHCWAPSSSWLLACAIGVPTGVLGGVYLSEYRLPAVNWTIRFLCDILNGVPSIIWGIVINGLIVIPMKSYSAYAGGLALGMPHDSPRHAHHRGSARSSSPMATGRPRSPWASPNGDHRPNRHEDGARGIITGVLLALARVAGETAPLLFTALGNAFWNNDLSKPIAALPLQIFTYAISPYDELASPGMGRRPRA